jgi:tetratricopeptide (TPR) repeat protein
MRIAIKPAGSVVDHETNGAYWLEDQASFEHRLNVATLRLGRSRTDVHGIAVERRAAMATTKRFWTLLLVVAFIIAVLSWGGGRLWEVERYQKSIGEIEAQIVAGRTGQAARNLASLLAWKPNLVDAIYLLGVCERARGRPEAAFEAWARIPPGSQFWGQALLGRTELLVEHGRLGDAEQIVELVQHDTLDGGSIVSMVLVPMYCQEGRFEEARRLIEAQWDQLNQVGEGASEQAINFVRLYMDIGRQTPLVAAARVYLEQAAKVAPDDDRVWLGRADLAIRDGSYDQAARWLDACLRRRPQDASVWRTKLKYAMATNQLPLMREALTHFPADQSTPAEIHRLAVWLAKLRGDVESERRALELLSAADPVDLSALERLAELAVKDGQPARAVALRQRQLKTEQLRARYEQLYTRNQPMRDAAEMARLATQLGHELEARAFLTIAVAVDPGRGDLPDELKKMSRQPSPIDRSGRTLAQVLAAELGAPINRSDRSMSSQSK